MNLKVGQKKLLKVSPKYNDDVNNMFHMVLDLFFREEKFQCRNSFTKSISCKRKSMIFENENTFESSYFLNITLSLISLNEFSSDEDIEKSNFKIVLDLNPIYTLLVLITIYHVKFFIYQIYHLVSHSNINIDIIYLDFTFVSISRSFPELFKKYGFRVVQDTPISVQYDTVLSFVIYLLPIIRFYY